MVDSYLKNPEFTKILDLIYKNKFADANLKIDPFISADSNNFSLNNLKGVILLNLRDLNNAEIFFALSI